MHACVHAFNMLMCILLLIGAMHAPMLLVCLAVFLSVCLSVRLSIYRDSSWLASTANCEVQLLHNFCLCSKYSPS